jgi:Tfp pilus assembly protein PilF
MKGWKKFECLHCHETFDYEPSKLATDRFDEMELTTGRRSRILIDCPHCPTGLIVDQETGLVEAFTSEYVSKSAKSHGVFYDRTFTEAGQEKVRKLLAAGHELMSTNRARAESLFREALTIRKREPHAWYNLAVCRHDARDFTEAERCYRRALELDPKLLPAWNNLGTMLVEAGRIDEAERCFLDGTRVNPRHPKFFLGRANVRLARGDYAGARDLLEEVLQIDPDYQPARKLLNMIGKPTSLLSRLFRRS